MSRLSALPVATAAWSARHPWRAIVGWLAFVALCVGVAATVPTQGTTAADYRLGQSGQVSAMLDEAGMARPLSENLLITGIDGPADRTLAERGAREFARRAGALPEVGAVSAPVWSADQDAALVTVELVTGTADSAPLGAVTAEVAAAYPQLRLAQAGDLSLDKEINERVAADLRSAELITYPMTLVLMLLAFGALIAAGVPLVLAGTSVAATMGLAAPISHLIHAEPTVTSLIVLIGMAVGVDYSLFYLRREREERAKGAGTIDAVAIAARTSGHSVIVSGAAVIASLTGLYLLQMATFTSLATGAIVVVGVAVAGSLTVLPALLVVLGGPPSGACAVAAQPQDRRRRDQRTGAGSGAAPAGGRAARGGRAVRCAGLSGPRYAPR